MRFMLECSRMSEELLSYFSYDILIKKLRKYGLNETTER